MAIFGELLRFWRLAIYFETYSRPLIPSLQAAGRGPKPLQRIP
eukprot:COSAG01_NODE_69903_length_260_cov_0.633540_1_plen_42_part_01